MEDIFLFLRDDAGGWVSLERTVSFLLAHLKMKRTSVRVVHPGTDHEHGTPYYRGGRSRA